MSGNEARYDAFLGGMVFDGDRSVLFPLLYVCTNDVDGRCLMAVYICTYPWTTVSDD